MTKIKIGFTPGDINGIGYEVILKSLMDIKNIPNAVTIIYGSPKVLAYYKKNLGNNVNTTTINSAEEAKNMGIFVINCNSEDIRVEAGKSNEIAGLASFQALEKATADLKNKEIDILVTGPINKWNIQSAGFNFPGHTEYLAQQFNADKCLMLMCSEALKVGVATGHIPISEVSKALTKELILEKLEILNDSLKRDFIITKPRIAVLGLNPHCGDHGVIGNEEESIIIPAINEARGKDILAFGPYSADGFFGSGDFKKFDAVLAMYHDQGLAPFKALTFDDGVNYTAGLPIVRTSPAHGTAYEIAGKNQANYLPMCNAIRMAVDIFNNRRSLENLEESRHNVDDYNINEINTVDE